MVIAMEILEGGDAKWAIGYLRTELTGSGVRHTFLQ